MHEFDYDNHYEQVEQLNKTEGRTRAKRRRNNQIKIDHKIRYNNHGFPIDCRNVLNKGKNFCSCSMCTPKTNNKGKRYFGRGKVTWKTRNWKHSDKRIIEMMEDKLYEYENEYIFWKYWDRHDEYLKERWQSKSGCIYDYWYQEWLEEKDEIEKYLNLIDKYDDPYEWAVRAILCGYI